MLCLSAKDSTTTGVARSPKDKDFRSLEFQRQFRILGSEFVTYFNTFDDKKFNFFDPWNKLVIFWYLTVSNN